MYEFDYLRPATLSEAKSARHEDEDAVFLAGGQTLLHTMKARLAMPSTVISLAAIEALRGVTVRDDGGVTFGAMCTHAEIAHSAQIPTALADLAGNIGDPAVRNKGTIGGSLANNDPSACWPAAVLACDAVIVTDRRRIAADDFFDGLFTTSLDEGELICTIEFPATARTGYAKFEQPASRFALVGVFVAQAADGAVRVAVTGASEEGVFRWSEAEAALSANFEAAALSDLTMQADAMIADVHGTPAYRAHLVRVMTERAVAAAN